MIRYQNRFIREFAIPKEGSIYITDPTEIKKWRQYYTDQQILIDFDSYSFSAYEKQRIREAIRDFAWTPERTVLIKEPME